MKLKTTHGLLIIAVLSLVLILNIAFGLDNVLRIIIGLPFVLFFPGYTLIATLFPSRTSLDIMGRVALSFGLSLVVAVLIGLALNFTLWGINLNSILISSIIFIVIMSIIAWVRQTRLPDNEKPSVSFNLASWGKQSRLDKSRLDKILLWVLPIAILGAIGILGYVIAQPKTGDAFTDFYILDANGKTDNYPNDIKLGDNASITLCIVNHDGAETFYRTEITIGGILMNTIGPITLQPEQKYENILSFTPQNVGDNQEVEFLLYKNGQSDVYQELHLWVNVN